ncbi:MAG: helix-turn-helix transcriptional regulator [Maritimibacter sp.]
MPNQASGNELAAMLRFEPVAPSVRGRTYAAGRGSFANLNLIAIVTRGSASLIRAGETLNILSHSVMVLPHGAEAELQVPAGTRAWLIGFARPLQSLIVGTGPESLMLDQVLARLTLTPGNRDVVEATIVPLLPLLEQEITDPRKSSQTAVAALMRLLLIATSRMLDASDLGDFSNDSVILNRFRQLVELGYRSRKPVAAYCDELNLTYDRLHEICQRQLQRTPLALIRQRTLLDASTRLLQSDESIHMIGDQLGFDDPTKFSHFFKRATGLSPRQFRQEGRQSKTRQADAGNLTFSDWP